MGFEGSMLTRLDSGMKLTPHTDDSSTTNTSPGKTTLALPGTENQKMFEDEYEVEEVMDKELVDAQYR